MTVFVNQPGDDFLADAAFPSDQYRSIGICNGQSFVEHFIIDWASAHDFQMAEGLFFVELIAVLPSDSRHSVKLLV